MCNRKFVIDEYKSFSDLLNLELITLSEKRAYYWEKLTSVKHLPEDHYAFVAMVLFIDREIMIKELNIKLLKPENKEIKIKHGAIMNPNDRIFYYAR